MGVLKIIDLVTIKQELREVLCVAGTRNFVQISQRAGIILRISARPLEPCRVGLQTEVTHDVGQVKKFVVSLGTSIQNINKGRWNEMRVSEQWRREGSVERCW